MFNTQSIAIVIPVYNDWDSIQILISQINTLYSADAGYKVKYFIINDGSTLPVPVTLFNDNEQITIIQLTRNLGHQRAITIGLCYVSELFNEGTIVIMDSDGEDKPEQIKSLLEASIKFNGIVFSGRSGRQEGFIFRMFYLLYKFLFFILTNQKIPFGNFCIIPNNQIKRIVHVPEIWNHFAGGLMRSKIPYMNLWHDRGKRFEGKSKMSLSSLIFHGISSISVYLDVVAVRAFILSIILICVCFFLFILMIYYKYFTPYAIKGWATYTTIGLAIIVLQTFFTSLIIAFIVSNTRNQPIFIPILNYWKFIDSINGQPTGKHENR